jgi:hypothetical protein
MATTVAPLDCVVLSRFFVCSPNMHNFAFFGIERHPPDLRPFFGFVNVGLETFQVIVPSYNTDYFAVVGV